MISVYPFGSGSLYTASYAISASYAPSASLYVPVVTASYAGKILYPRSGSTGKGICLLTQAQAIELYASGQTKIDICNF